MFLKVSNLMQVSIIFLSYLILVCQSIELKNSSVQGGLPEKVLGSYLCGDTGIINAQQIADSGFNVIYSSFFDLIVENGELVIKSNRCCGLVKPFQLLKELKQKGIKIIASMGGDGCQGSAPSGLLSLTDEQIYEGFLQFQQETGVDWDGIDIDWEASSDSSTPQALNRLGSALIPKGVIVTAVPMSSQFIPQGVPGWTGLNSSFIDVVAPQWYQGGCIGTQSCPCWGPHSVEDLTKCPGFGSTYLGQPGKCSINQWVQGFKQLGFEPNKILIGAKSWCGGDIPSTCSASDTGIWGYQQMINILKVTGARGVYFWDLNDYYVDAFYSVGNPINDKCKFSNKIAEYLNLPHKRNYNNDGFCANYKGPMPQACG